MEIICADTNLLIDYFRKKDKNKTRLYELAQTYQVAIPAIVAYEYLRGDKTTDQGEFFEHLFGNISVLPFDLVCARHAATIWQEKGKGVNIEPEDLLIAATAIAWNYPLATLNQKHFKSIPGIQFI